MIVTNEQYLKDVLKSKKLELENLQIDNQVRLAVHNTKKDMLYQQIDSITKQLEINENN